MLRRAFLSDLFLTIGTSGLGGHKGGSKSCSESGALRASRYYKQKKYVNTKFLMATPWLALTIIFLTSGGRSNHPNSFLVSAMATRGYYIQGETECLQEFGVRIIPRKMVFVVITEIKVLYDMKSCKMVEGCTYVVIYSRKKSQSDFRVLRYLSYS